MNIFAVDSSPVTSANWLWDRDFKRANKMILESTQMLCTALNIWHGSQVTPYKSTHINHPCNVWVRGSSGNWWWLWRYAMHLTWLYNIKTDKQHKCRGILWKILELEKPITKELTPFVNCARNAKLGLDFTHLPVHEAYKQYLTAKWSN